MSDPGEQSPSYFCHNCGTTNTNGNICSQCRSEFLEEIPTLDVERISDDQQVPLIRQFQNLFNNGFDMQSFANMLLPMLMVQRQADVPLHRHRRVRPPRRIKRVTHRYLPFLDFLPIHNPGSQISPGEVLNSQLQTNMTLVQVPLQLFIFDQNGENLNQEMLTQLFNDDTSTLPVTRDDINQLSTLAMTPSTLSVNPSCAICLENFDASSEVKQLTTCHHVFHTNCLTEWLLRHGSCPMCRSVIPSTQQTPVPIFNDQWMQQFFFRTFEQQQQQQQMNIPTTNAIVPYLPVKTINPSQISSNTTMSIHPSSRSSDTPQLPHFDSQTQVHDTDSSSNTK